MKCLCSLVAVLLSAALFTACGQGLNPSASIQHAATFNIPYGSNSLVTQASVGRKLYVTNTSGGSITVYAPGATSPKRKIRDLNTPNTMALDSRGAVYVAVPNTVKVYAPRKSQLLRKIPGGAATLACDSIGNLYVGLAYAVNVYAQRGKTLLRTVSQGIDNPQALAFDSSGNLYVANYYNATITVYAPGSTSVLRTISQGLGETLTLAFDVNGNLYAANWVEMM